MKRCRVCGLEKALTEFKFRNDNNKFRNECKACGALFGKDYYKKHKTTIVQYAKSYYIKNRKEILKRVKEKNPERKNKARFGGNKYLVFERDNYKCQICGSSDKLLVHHRDTNNHTKETLNHKIDNLQALCRSCHTAIHHRKHFGCLVDGCTNKHHAKGYCSSHQNRRADVRKKK